MLFNNRTKILIFFLLLFKGLLFSFSCANMVAPTGGPRDTIPPIVIRSAPPNYSTNFKGQSVRIFFNEYVELKNVRQKLIVSPPLETMPEFRIRGRSIIMQINDNELMPNTTYNFFFDDAIVDLTENNPISNFRFVFSTGDYLDSLSVKGRVVDAYTFNPEEGVYVMLYDSIYDSIPYIEKPTYIAKADKEGNFLLSFLRKGEYKIFALQDINSNYIFDLPNEKIAFLDSLITPEYIELFEAVSGYEENDETPLSKIDSLDNNDIDYSYEEPLSVESDDFDLIQKKQDNNINDSLFLDSITIPIPEHSFYKMYLFEEEDTVQKIASSSLIRQNVLLITFRVKTDSVSFRDIRKPLPPHSYLKEFNTDKDSLTIWLKDIERDSLFLEIADKEIIVDTVKMSLEFRERAARGRRPADDPPVKSIAFKNNLKPGNILPYFENFFLLTDNPIKTYNDQCFKLLMNDSIPVEASFEITGESNRKLIMNSLLEPDESYFLKVLDSCVTDIYSISHDTLKLRFKVNSEEEYGQIKLDLRVPKKNKQYILKLLNDKSEIVRKRIITGSSIYVFENLTPGNFSFKLIEDINRDGRWTSGVYLKWIQPERVFIYTDIVQLRANWIMENSWVVKTPQIDAPVEPEPKLNDIENEQ